MDEVTDKLGPLDMLLGCLWAFALAAGAEELGVVMPFLCPQPSPDPKLQQLRGLPLSEQDYTDPVVPTLPDGAFLPEIYHPNETDSPWSRSMQSDKGTKKTKHSPHTQLEGGSSRRHPSLLKAPGQLPWLHPLGEGRHPMVLTGLSQS